MAYGATHFTFGFVFDHGPRRPCCSQSRYAPAFLPLTHKRIRDSLRWRLYSVTDTLIPSAYSRSFHLYLRPRHHAHNISPRRRTRLYKATQSASLHPSFIPLQLQLQLAYQPPLLRALVDFSHQPSPPLYTRTQDDMPICQVGWHPSHRAFLQVTRFPRRTQPSHYQHQHLLL